MSQGNFIHGDYKTPLYAKWMHIRKRCNVKSNTAYKNYGAKGITVCKSWGNYLIFKKWALSSGFKKGLTIDRINPKGNYTPSNCQWITFDQNRRRVGK